MTSALMTRDQMREHVETGIANDALDRLISIAETDVLNHAGPLGNATLYSVLFRAEFLSGASQAEPVSDAVITIGDTGVVLVSLTWDGSHLMIGSETYDSMSAAEVFGTAGAAGRHSLYVTNEAATAELPSSLFDADSVSPDAAWDVPATRRYKHLRDTLTAAVADGERFTLAVALANAALPLASKVERNRTVRRDVLIDLVKLAAQNGIGLIEEEVGSYQATYREYDRERGNILARLILSTGDVIV